MLHLSLTSTTGPQAPFPSGSDWVQLLGASGSMDMCLCCSSSLGAGSSSGPTPLPPDGPAWAPATFQTQAGTASQGCWSPAVLGPRVLSTPLQQTALSLASLQKSLGGCLSPGPGPYTPYSIQFGALPIARSTVLLGFYPTTGFVPTGSSQPSNKPPQRPTRDFNILYTEKVSFPTFN